MFKVALIGLGYWGRKIHRILKNSLSVELICICDISENRIIELSENGSTVTTYLNYKEIDINTIDAVFISTPASTHYKISSYFLLNKVNVFCEKPGFCSIEEGMNLKNILNRNVVTYMVGYTFLYNDVVNYVKNCMVENRMGQILYSDFIRAGLGPMREDVNVLYDLASHDISIANYFFGKAVNVLASAQSYNVKGHYDVASLVINYNNSVCVNIRVSWIEPYKQRIIKIISSSMMTEINDTNTFDKLRLYKKGITYQKNDAEYASFQTSLTDGDVLFPKVDYKEPLKNEISHFIHCIKLNIEPRTNIVQALDVVRIIEACEQSIKKNDFVEVINKI